MFNNFRPYPSIASDSEIKAFSATIPNTLKQKRRKTSSQANVNNSWKQLLFICIKCQHFKQEQEVCLYVPQPLCQRNMVRAGNTHVGGVKTTKPRIRIRRVARRHRLLEFDAEGKMRWRHSELHWSDPPILTLTRRQPRNKTHPPSTSRDF